MKLTNYENKYIKYKKKYLEIKNFIQKGGIDCKNERAFKNILGTCWMIVIQMMICFGDATKNIIEEIFKINKNDIDTHIKNLIQSNKGEIQKFFNKIFINDIKEENLLFDILKTFYTRYSSKIEIIKPVVIKPNPEINPLRCEKIINRKFKELFNFYDTETSKTGGDLIERFYFANILGIIFLENKIYFKNYTRKNFNKISFEPTEDIGLIINIHRHVCCCFICDGKYKFYNDNDRQIYNLDWYNLLLNLNENEDLFIIPNGLTKLDRDEYFKNIKKYYKLEYIKIQFITVVSKKNFDDKLNQQISGYINNNFYIISDFFLLFYLYYFKTNNEQYLKRSASEGYYDAQYYLGLLFLKRNLIPDGKKELENAVKSGSLQASYELGLIYKNEKNYYDAEKYFLIAYSRYFKEKKKEVAENLYDIYFNYYKNYKLSLNFKSDYSEPEVIQELEIISDFNKKKKLADDGFFDLQYDVGKKYLQDNDIPNAKKYFNLAVVSKEFDLVSIAAFELAKIYQKEKNIDEAKDYYNIAMQSLDIFISAEASFELGKIYYDNNDFIRATYYFKKTIEEDIYNISAEAALKLSEIYINDKKTKEAILCLKSAIEKKKSTDTLIKVASKLSEILINQNKETEAIPYLKIVIEKDYTDISEAAYKLGEILFNQKNFEEAAKYLEIAIKSYKSGKYELSVAELGKIYIEHYKNYKSGWNYKFILLPTYEPKIKKKLEDFNELKKLADEGYYDLQYDVGEKYLIDNNYAEAIKYFNKAMGTKQKDLLAKAALKLGEILLNKGRIEEAICYFNLVIENGVKYDKAYAYFKLGEINEEKNINEAIDDYTIAIYYLKEEEKYDILLSITCLKLGKFYLGKKNYLDAEYFLIDAINYGTDDYIIDESVQILINILKVKNRNKVQISDFFQKNIIDDNKKLSILKKLL